ncbi:hypothetical protein MPTK1_2g13730 [Marchantia polymorpha subsp. ruderalis]|uniref:Protein kinase domain-containing protein n=1 Tax=Marchantia polymorpha TaxID=3197 RepID=A0A2R6X1D4_MARPO|nr:hypothetical protein MARPO_0042s0002 [Marchantia polymorpha]BBN02224.1 hypothetical protein Mp_2g13730 [Marchantia polymorpha subsp. ruderalis]PTQ39926.1 hypothetical protein MARPO_0042s0002 [Marchantia polymorpha]PTQ39927.1 hypothetical protein MARPO_0042s0002 [Marchantia polymorpha]PTQ39928.1 hypothetical protein MARPO_0042s0002 [Marchantia polymorpha]|eukprot:PTQ39925.1 hypothetical protein MARPO_0042s0002 [Marchantia polymorpha]
MAGRGSAHLQPNPQLPRRGADMGRNDDRPHIALRTLRNDIDIRDHYNITGVLGQGAFGRCYEVRKIGNERIRLAMKELTKDVAGNPDVPELRRLFNEIIIMNRVLSPHPHIVELRDLILGVEKLFIVTEKCCAKNLEDFYPSANNYRGKKIFKQLVEAVHFMHQHGVVHNDLKAQNVMFATTLMRDIKVIDFGLATYHQDLATRTHANFEPRQYYQDDELHPPGDPYTQTFKDIRQLGNILHSILAGTEVDFSEDEVYVPDDLAPVRTQIFDARATNLLDLIGPIRRHNDPNGRLATVPEILQHPWLA